ncbi:hypothetical protein D3C86_1580500 [compost metagenome]
MELAGALEIDDGVIALGVALRRADHPRLSREERNAHEFEHRSTPPVFLASDRRDLLLDEGRMVRHPDNPRPEQIQLARREPVRPVPQ